MKDIAIFGAGGFGREVFTLINDINKVKHTYNFIGYFDDLEYPEDVKIIGNKNDLKEYNKPLNIVFAIGNTKVKKEFIEYTHGNDNLTFPVLIHPNCIIGNEETVKIGEGSIITAGNIITTDIVIGKHVILNLSCTVGHDTTIENYCSIMPGVNISGQVNLCEGVYVGTGAKIINQLEIGQNSVIGSGAVVTKNIPSNVTAVGVPAKVL